MAAVFALGRAATIAKAGATPNPQIQNVDLKAHAPSDALEGRYIVHPWPRLARQWQSQLGVKSKKRIAANGGVIPLTGSIPELAAKAKNCRNCDLWRNATQTVFGEGGGARPRIMLIGEQPGNEEDKEGQPFVGPAGRLLDRLLVEAGIDRKKVYVPNAVKHFNWEPRGKRRIHKKPSAREIDACRPWLDAEICRDQASCDRVFGCNRGASHFRQSLSRDAVSR